MTTASPLSPHSLVQIGLKIFSSQTLSSISAQFKLTPGRLHFLRVHTCTRIHEIVRMDHSLVCVNVRQPGQTMVCCPIVSVHVSSRYKTSLYNWQQSSGISSVDDLKVASGWTVFQRNYSKHPRVTDSPPSSVVLQDKKNANSSMCIYIFRKGIGCLGCA